ncbi:DUF1127 domain-containing protein [Labrenzia sp. OB1]|uniref:DUF1127 domain-containing protein n=1 Tax=Labrenzia sp. OB1 TaxID=1561204 RepID=UPI0009EDEF8C|nr:DUF1127 domain-containing protein [Labrenzia sp. OB1]
MIEFVEMVHVARRSYRLECCLAKFYHQVEKFARDTHDCLKFAHHTRLFFVSWLHRISVGASKMRTDAIATLTFQPLRSDLFSRVISDLLRRLRHRRDMKILSEMPDYLLDDIGLSRSDLPGPDRVGETLR